MKIRSLFLILLLGVSSVVAADRKDSEVKWKVYQHGLWTDFQKGDETVTLHLPVDQSEVAGKILQIQSPSTFYLFIDGKLISKGKHSTELKIDSLAKIYSKAFTLSIYAAHGFGKFKSHWIENESEFDKLPRSSNQFSSFIIVAVVILLIFITALLRTNPQLTQDYLNVSRLFNLRDRDDGQSLRITSSVNLLFYFFCSALAALALCITAHDSAVNISFMPGFENISVGKAFGQWVLFSVLIFCLMMIKLVLLFIISNLFGWRDTPGFQFFNFIRMVILSLTIIALVSVVSFSFGISLNYLTLLKLACFMLAAGAVVIYLKLLARATFHFFHLFFYLCATEVLPLIILTKVLLF